MKKYSLLTAAMAGMLLTACTMNDSVENADNTAQAEQTPIAFDTYLGEYGNTRAGYTGEINSTEILKQGNVGFSVFAYYIDGGAAYSGGTKPNFMYNQKVEWNGSAWTYAPIKYWPNETKSDGNGATSAQTDRLSFLTYAPYVDATEFTVDGATGAIAGDDSGNYAKLLLKKDGANYADGIFGIPKNSEAGDAYIAYQVAKNAGKSVDLLWGTADQDKTIQSVNETKAITAGLPYLDLSKQQVNDKIKFQFHHALSRFTFGTAVAAVDQPTPGDDKGTLKSSTKILIDEISITAAEAGKVALRGMLDLKNTTANVANWEKIVTADADAELFRVDKDNLLNPRLQYESTDDTAFNDLPDGVTKTAKNLLSGSNLYWMLIPPKTWSANTSQKLNVKIKYHVVTEDSELTKKLSDVTNEITKQVELDFEQGKSYKLNMVIGVTSVKFEAEVTPWTDDSPEDSDLDLPQNKEDLLAVWNTAALGDVLKDADGNAVALKIGDKLAVGLTDIENKPLAAQEEIPGLPLTSFINEDEARKDTAGFAHTKALLAKYPDGDYAANQLKNYTPKAPTGAAWIIPSIGQWIEFFEIACGATAYDPYNWSETKAITYNWSSDSGEKTTAKTLSDLNTYLTTIGVANLPQQDYHASSLTDADGGTSNNHSYIVHLVNGNLNILYNGSRGGYAIRPFLVWD